MQLSLNIGTFVSMTFEGVNNLFTLFKGQSRFIKLNQSEPNVKVSCTKHVTDHKIKAFQVYARRNMWLHQKCTL